MRLNDQIALLHEVLAGSRQPASPLDNLTRREFINALATFAAFIASLPAPVILVLDTCEEIAKLAPVGGRLPSVEATFRVLEGVHAAVPGMRVIFAGRRLLARSGHEWSADAQAMSAFERSLPDRKEFLRMHAIRGFTAEEAGRYLRVTRGIDDHEVVSAILEHSPEPGAPGPVHASVDESTRYSPFDVDLYASLVIDEDLGANELARHDDPYVDLRIVRRADDLADALPVVALLRRFDRALLALCCGEDRADALFDTISAYEWVDTYVGEGGRFAEVKWPLQDRLLTFLATSAHRDALEAIRGRLAEQLPEWIDATALSELAPAHLDAALRILEPVAAAELWTRVELRIPGEGNWGWAFNVTRELLGDATRGNSPLHAAVVATHAASMVHLHPAVDRTGPWLVVLDSADQDARPVARHALRARALLGLEAAGSTAALATAATSPDLAIYDRRRVAEAVKAHVDELRDLGMGLTRSVAPSLDELIASSRPVAEAMNLPQITVAELLAD